MKALVLVNLQIDFCAGGALEVAHADRTLALAKRLMPQYDLVVAVREWHPANHVSFAAMHPWRRPGQRIRYEDNELLLQPMHSVQDSFGAEFAPGIPVERFAAIFNIGTEADTDQYSAFFDRQQKNPSGLHDFLQQHGVEALYMSGLAHDHTLSFTALDAVKLGYQCHFILEKTVFDLKNELFSEMSAAGVSIVEENV